MSEKRTIQINPESFKVSKQSTTRKKRDASPKIQLKSNREDKKQNQKSIRRNIIKMIREKQQDEYRKMFDDKKSSEPSNKSSNPVTDDFSKDFEDSYKFLSELAAKEAGEVNSNLSKSFKKYPDITPTESLLLQPSMRIETNENVALDIPDELKMPVSNIPFQYKPQTPQYGCLKNGNLPTFRTWKNQTQKIYPKLGPTPHSVHPPAHPSTHPSTHPLPQRPIEPSPVGPVFNKPCIVSNPTENQPTSSPVLEVSQFQLKPPAQKSSWEEALEVQNKIKRLKNKMIAEKKATFSSMMKPNKKQIRNRKQRKIYRRTYKVGKSTVLPKVGVLVSNHTIRSRIKNQTNELSKVPIKDVRRFLIKKGFIKVGTVAPPDVLRKMFESVSTVCGEVKNHNSENMLYNFLNDKE